MRSIRGIVTVVFLLFSVGSYAQNKGIGLKAGFNFSRIEGADQEAMEGRIGYQIGIQTNMRISNKIYFGPDFMAIQKGTQNVELLYFKAPIYWKYFLTDKFHLDFGPYAAYLYEATSAEVVIKSEFQALDLGGSFGVGGYIGKINIDLKFHRGFKDVQQDDSIYLIAQEGEVDAANSTVEFSLGYLF